MAMKVLSNIEVQSVCVDLAARCVSAFSIDIRFIYTWLHPDFFFHPSSSEEASAATV